MGHTLIISHKFGFSSRGLNVLWRLMWFAAVAAPYFWGLSIFYYSRNPTAGRWVRRTLTAIAFFTLLAVLFVFPLPSFWEFFLAPVLAPVIAWVYVPYLILCFLLPLIALRRQRRAPTRDPFRRARPWLIGTAFMLVLAVNIFAAAAYFIVPQAIPFYTLTADVLRELYIADECFMTGTAANVTPVLEIDRRSVGNWKVGKITTQIQDGKLLATGCADGDVRVFTLPGAQLLRTLTNAVGNKTGSMAFSPDGGWLVSSSEDETLRLWKYSDQAFQSIPTVIFSGHIGAVRCVDFSPRGDQIISGADDHRLRVWSLPEQVGP